MEPNQDEQGQGLCPSDDSKKVPIILLIVAALFGFITFAYFYLSDHKTESVQTGYSQFSEDERTYLLDITNVDEEYTKAVAEAAVTAEQLVIGSNCSMQPLVLRQELMESLQIVNNDSEDRVIAFEDQNFFSVSAGRSREIDLVQFGRTGGVYRYRCGDLDKEQNVGVLYIVGEVAEVDEFENLDELEDFEEVKELDEFEDVIIYD